MSQNGDDRPSGEDGQKETLVPLNDVIDVVDKVAGEVLVEDKTGATRDMVATGTCRRVERELREEFDDGE